MSRRIEQAVMREWYRRAPSWGLALAPLSVAFRALTSVRYRRFKRHREQPPVPLLVVGNITVGGTGKTPLVIALCQQLQQRGARPVVISRGYGSAAPAYPFVVNADSRVEESGDEPLLIARRTGVPVVIDAQRRQAMKRAVSLGADVIISDDGLQHYHLPRTAEIVVLDGERGLGNGWCLPTGPLREAKRRLKQVDWIVVNGGSYAPEHSHRMILRSQTPINLVTGEHRPLADFITDCKVEAVAAIGHPERFFSVLEEAGLSIVRHPFPDHHAFTAKDLDFEGDNAVIMTEKDCVKCAHFARPNVWFLPVEAILPTELIESICQRLLGSYKS